MKMHDHDHHLTDEQSRPKHPVAQSLERRRLQYNLIMMLVDCALIVLSFLLIGLAYLGNFPSNYAIGQSQLLLPIYLIIAVYNRTYSARGISHFRFGVTRMAMAAGLASALLIFIGFYAKITTDISRVFLTLGSIGAVLLMAAARYVGRRLFCRWFGPAFSNVLVIIDGGPRTAPPHAVIVEAEDHGLRADLDDPDALDRFGRYVMHMDRVIISCAVGDREKWAFLMRAAGVRGEFMSQSLKALRPISLNKEHGIVSLVVSTKPLGLRQRVIKRLMDMAITVPALIMLSPVMLVTALVIKLQDGGPVFFVQRRIGKGNQQFNVLKFRSMMAERADSAGAQSASRNDARVTKFGKIIRATSVDELPQLLNVLRGDMSLVGPRPHALGSLAGEKLFWEVDPDYWHRHSLKPGLTGLAQVRGHRGATEEERDLSLRLRSDLEYIANWSPWNDLLILLQTVRVLVHDRAF